MEIVILDGAAANPGDLSWAGIQALGETTVYDWTKPEEVVARAQNAQVIILNRIRMDAAVLEQLPKLRYIGALATGVNTIDLAAAAARGIPVCNVPEYCVQSVAQAALSLLLALTNHVGTLSQKVRAGGWTQALAETGTKRPIIDLTGKTLGIVGYGNIGKTMAALGQLLGMHVLVHTRTPKGGEVSYVSLETVLQESDVLSLHCALTADTQEMINAERLALMKPTALLLNTARGGLIDEAALANALNTGALAGAGLDVTTQEPPLPTNPLLGAKNCIITPHVAWFSPEARGRLLQTVTENLAAWQAGKVQNQVN